MPRIQNAFRKVSNFWRPVGVVLGPCDNPEIVDPIVVSHSVDVVYFEPFRDISEVVYPDKPMNHPAASSCFNVTIGACGANRFIEIPSLPLGEPEQMPIFVTPTISDGFFSGVLQLIHKMKPTVSGSGVSTSH